MIDFRKIRAALKELERIHKILKKDKGCHYFDQNYTVNILVDCKIHPEKGPAIKMMMKLAKDVKYTGLYGMNNLIIHI